MDIPRTVTVECVISPPDPFSDEPSPTSTLYHPSILPPGSYRSSDGAGSSSPSAAEVSRSSSVSSLAARSASVSSSVAPSATYTHATYHSRSSAPSPSSVGGPSGRIASDLLRLRDPCTPARDASRIVGALAKASRTDVGRAALILAGAVPAVTAGMALRPTVRDAQEWGCAVLRNIAVEGEVQRRRIALAEGIPVVLGAMRAHPADGRVQEQGCGTLRNLAWDSPINKALIAKKGGVSVIAEAMRTHRGDGAVVGQALRALRNLAKESPPNILAVSGALPVIISAMAQHLTNESLQHDGCAILRNLSASVDSRAAVAAAGGVSAIVETMRSHEKAEKLQAQACAALSNLSLCGGNLTLMREDKHCKKTLKSTLKRFPESCGKHSEAILQRMADGSREFAATPPLAPKIDKGLSLGRNNLRSKFLSRRSGGRGTGDGPSIASSKESESDVGSSLLGIDHAPEAAALVILRRIQALRDDILSHEDAVEIINDVERLARGGGGLDVTLEGSTLPTSLSSSSHSLPRGLTSSRRLAGGGHRQAIFAAGGLPTLTAYMGRTVASAPVQSASCWALSSLCNGDDVACAEVTAGGGIAAVLVGMDTHPFNAKVQAAGCSALRTLTLTVPVGVQNRDTIRLVGGIEALVAAMHSHSEDIRVLEHSLGALCQLTQKSKLNCVAAAEAGAIPVVMVVLAAQSRTPTVQERGCRFLSQVSEIRDLADLIRAEEPALMLWDSADRYPLLCGEWCRRVLQNI